MKARIVMVVLFFSFTGLGCFESESEQPKTTGASQTTKSPSLCILAGNLQNAKKAAQGLEAFGNLIRLRFTAASIESCREQVIDYCRSRSSEGLTPENLIMTFRADAASEHTDQFTVTSRCSIQSKDD